MPSEPLRDWEIEMLRGMIDEYRMRLEREKMLTKFWTSGRITLATIGAILIVVLNLVQLVVVLGGR